MLLEKEPNNFQSKSLNALIEKAVAKGESRLVLITTLSQIWVDVGLGYCSQRVTSEWRSQVVPLLQQESCSLR